MYSQVQMIGLNLYCAIFMFLMNKASINIRKLIKQIELEAEALALGKPTTLVDANLENENRCLSWLERYGLVILISLTTTIQVVLFTI